MGVIHPHPLLVTIVHRTGHGWESGGLRCQTNKRLFAGFHERGGATWFQYINATVIFPRRQSLLLTTNHHQPLLLSLTNKMSKPSTPQPSNTLLLRRQLTELTKHPVQGFSAGDHPPLSLDLEGPALTDLWRDKKGLLMITTCMNGKS